VSVMLRSSKSSSYWRMALVLNEREAARRRREFERRPEERKRLTAREEAIEIEKGLGEKELDCGRLLIVWV